MSVSRLRLKGREDRIVPVCGAAAALDTHLRTSRPELVARVDSALFLSRDGARLGAAGLRARIQFYGRRTGVRLTPHALRHPCATHLLRGGADLRHVQALLGHRRLTTTALYTRVAITDLRSVNLLLSSARIRTSASSATVEPIVLAAQATTTTTSWCGPLSTSKPHVGAPIDANGNLTTDGTRTFEWDARNQLVAVTGGTHRSEFTYDGLQRRVRVVEKESGVTQSETKVLWCEDEICEERAADGVTVTQRPFTLGEQVAGAARFFGVDHLGSVGDVTDTASTLVARYAFDPWGRRTLTTGSDVTTVGLTGHRWHSTAGLWLALYRGYDADLARWAIEDPSGFVDGPNLYTYVRNTPVVLIDPLGLESEEACADAGNPEELKKCLKACDDGTKGREKYCRSLKNPKLRAGCWALVYGSKAACKGWCYWQYGE